jgi:hypothetical protein
LPSEVIGKGIVKLFSANKVHAKGNIAICGPKNGQVSVFEVDKMQTSENAICRNIPPKKYEFQPQTSN